MLSVNSITSLDQGKLFCAPKNEDDFYARFTTASDKAKPAIQRKTPYSLRFTLGRVALSTHERSRRHP